MNKVQEAVARSLDAQRGDYPEARLALDSMALDLANVTGVANEDVPAFMAAAAAETMPEPSAERALPQTVLDLLATTEAPLYGDSYDAEHDALRDLAEYLRDLYAVEVACAKCGTPHERGDRGSSRPVRECADTDQDPSE
jgi:hypothetical protein